jgi:hypothetical protein
VPEVYEAIKSTKADNSAQSTETAAADPPNGSASRRYVLIALNFKSPTYVKIDADKEINFDSKLKVEGKEVAYEGSVIGNVIVSMSAEGITVDTTYDIKYTGGYSKDGRIIYLDRDFPKKLGINGKEVDAVETIAKHHELIEKWMIGEGYTYQYAHVIATKIEREYVESLGVNWEDYSMEVGKHLHEVSSKKMRRSPADLDLSPYTASNDTAALEEIASTMQVAGAQV